MDQQKKVIPVFNSEQEEREFWTSHDSSEYIDWDKAAPAIFPELKPTMKTVSLRLPETMLNCLKVLVNERDVPYQSLIKIYLRERIDIEYEPKQNK